MLPSGQGKFRGPSVTTAKSLSFATGVSDSACPAAAGPTVAITAAVAVTNTLARIVTVGFVIIVCPSVLRFGDQSAVIARRRARRPEGLLRPCRSSPAPGWLPLALDSPLWQITTVGRSQTVPVSRVLQSVTVTVSKVIADLEAGIL